VAGREHPSATPSARSSGGASADVSGVHGTELSSVLVNETELIEGAPTTISGKEGSKSKSASTNQGESTESGVGVAVTYEGNTVTGEIDEIAVGEPAPRRFR
jgi:hypothetical protein